MNQSTYASVVNSTASHMRQRSRRRITSALKRPRMISVWALSWPSSTLPTDGAIAAYRFARCRFQGLHCNDTHLQFVEAAYNLKTAMALVQ